MTDRFIAVLFFLGCVLLAVLWMAWTNAPDNSNGKPQPLATVHVVHSGYIEERRED